MEALVFNNVLILVTTCKLWKVMAPPIPTRNVPNLMYSFDKEGDRMKIRLIGFE